MTFRPPLECPSIQVMRSPKGGPRTFYSGLKSEKASSLSALIIVLIEPHSIRPAPPSIKIMPASPVIVPNKMTNDPASSQGILPSRKIAMARVAAVFLSIALIKDCCWSSLDNEAPFLSIISVYSWTPPCPSNAFPKRWQQVIAGFVVRAVRLIRKVARFFAKPTIVPRAIVGEVSNP